MKRKSDQKKTYKKDKKNKGDMLGLIFPVGDKAEIQRVFIPADETFVTQCEAFFARMDKQ